MANSYAAFNPEIWYPVQQKLLDEQVVAKQIGNFNIDAKYGDVFHNPYGSRVFLEDRTKYSDMTAQDYTATDDSFTIDQNKGCMVTLDKVDAKQSMYSIQAAIARRFQAAANEHIDSIFLGEYDQAVDDIYNDDVGGSGATTAASLNSGNIARVFSVANKKLKQFYRSVYVKQGLSNVFVSYGNP